MIIAQIQHVAMIPSAADTLPHSTYITVSDWLGQWTPQSNFKAVIADTKDEAVEKLRQKFNKELVPIWLASRGVTPYHFFFEIGIIEIENGELWLTPLRLCRNFHVKGEQP